MDWSVFLNALITILAFGSFIGLAIGFSGEYKDAKTDEDKRKSRNKYITLFIVSIIIVAAAFGFLNGYLIPTLKL